jgi:hypothetical protein
MKISKEERRKVEEWLGSENERHKLLLLEKLDHDLYVCVVEWPHLVLGYQIYDIKNLGEREHEGWKFIECPDTLQGCMAAAMGFISEFT